MVEMAGATASCFFLAMLASGECAIEKVECNFLGTYLEADIDIDIGSVEVSEVDCDTGIPTK